MSARVSVIISTYNRAPLLKRAIKSVLEQSMADLELIVVDDCSTEGSVERLVHSFGDPRVKYIRTPENSGHDGRPKNLGIMAAEGEYIAFLDDDDQYRRDALKILLAYASQSKMDLVYGDYLIDGQPGWSVDFSAARLSQMNFISMSVVMAKKNAIVKVGGFDEDVPKFKDWNLWLRMQKSGATFLHIPIITTEVSGKTPGSISTKFSNKRRADGSYDATYFNPADCLIYPDKTSLGERKPLKIAVYTLTRDRLEYTKRMAAALEALAGYPFDWYVIDQGSKDGTQDWLKSLTRDRDISAKQPGKEVRNWREKLRYRLYEQNVGLAKGWNAIVDFIRSEGEYDIIIKVDNDAEMFSYGWLDKMVGVFERNRKVILSPYVEGLENSPGGVLRQRASGDSPYMLINDRVLGLVPNLGGIVFATPIEIWKDWKFDEAYEGNKDYIFSQYAKKHGYSLFYMEELRVWHIDGTLGQHKKFPEYFGEATPAVEADDKEIAQDTVENMADSSLTEE